MIKIKTADEIDKIRQASRIVAEVLRELEPFIKEGISTLDIDKIAEDLLIKKGAQPAFKGYRGYPSATCLSVNEEVVHAIPNVRCLKNGDVLSVDVGALCNGYYGDGAISVMIGQVPKKVEKLVKTTKVALQAGIKQARCGNHLGDISHAIEKTAQKAGFTVVRDLFGHGIGKELHEDPLIPNFGRPQTGPVLLPGMVFAIEPMLNMGTHHIITKEDGWTIVTADNKVSVHFEHTVLITQGNPEILTKVVS